MKTSYKNLVIKGKLKNEGVTFPNSNNIMRHNQYLITVVNSDTKKRISFDFYDSNKNYTDGVKELSNENLLDAFNCFVSDSVAGDMGVDEFINEFGYDIKTGKRIHRLCQKSLEKFEKIISDDMYDFSNELNELING